MPRGAAKQFPTGMTRRNKRSREVAGWLKYAYLDAKPARPACNRGTEMRLFSILTAIATVAVLFFLVFQRDDVLRLAGYTDEAVAEANGTAGADAAAPVGIAEAPAVVVAPVAVIAVESTAREIDSAVVLRGRTEAVRTLELLAETGGKVVSQPMPKGSPVAAGDVLCEIDIGTREATLAEARARLAEAQANLPTAGARVTEAEAALASARLDLDNAEKLAEGGYASQTRVLSARAMLESANAALASARAGASSAEAAIESARAAVAATERDIANTRVTAPFEGMLETDTAELGSLMMAGSLCATIIDLDPIKLVGFVAEVDVDRVTPGAAVGARLASGREVLGKVTFLSRSADPQTRTFRVEAELANPDLTIRDGQTAEILISSAGRMAHLLPQSSLTLDDSGALGVRVAEASEAGDVARFIPVEMLRDSPDGVWLAGLPDRARVIVTGQDYVRDGVAISVTMREPGA